jgi:hypothetical protein
VAETAETGLSVLFTVDIFCRKSEETEFWSGREASREAEVSGWHCCRLITPFYLGFALGPWLHDWFRSSGHLGQWLIWHLTATSELDELHTLEWWLVHVNVGRWMKMNSTKLTAVENLTVSWRRDNNLATCTLLVR